MMARPLHAGAIRGPPRVPGRVMGGRFHQGPQEARMSKGRQTAKRKQSATKRASPEKRRPPKEARLKSAPSPSRESLREKERSYMDELIRRIASECPRRQPTSADEAKALDMMLAELEKAGLETFEHHFCFNDSLYKNLTLHAGLGVAGTAVSGTAPLIGLAMHLLAAGSYYADSTRKAYLLRRLFPFKPSRNVLGVLPADGEPSLRVVFVAHADAAFTGMTFWPSIVRLSAREGPESLKFLRRGLQLMVTTQIMLAGCDLLRLIGGPLALPLRPIEHLLTIPSWLALVLNGHVVLKDEIVPGANDNLSGSAALPVLAGRLGAKKRDDVEYVFCVTGCEEASLGGADALAREVEGTWAKDRTVFIALDSLSNGRLRFLEVEGEVRPKKVAAWISDVMARTAASDPRFEGVSGYEVPVGGSDAAAFQAHGWQAVGLTCIDPVYGPPRHYHLPTDTPDNLDMDQLMISVDFAEAVAETIVEDRLG